MTVKFGWCLDNRHDECRRFTFIMRDPNEPVGTEHIIGLTCDCTCHNESEDAA